MKKLIKASNNANSSNIKINTVITEEDISNAEQVLINEGYSLDEAQSVLQQIGYILLDTELFPYVEQEG